MCIKLLQLCLTLCSPMNYSPAGSSVQEILQARILEWVAISFSRGSSQPRNRTCITYSSYFGRQVLYTSASLYIRQNVNKSILFIYLFIFPFIFISWRLITLHYCSGFCHTLTWISHGFTCIPHPNPPSHLPLHPIPLGLPSAPAPSTCLMQKN